MNKKDYINKLLALCTKSQLNVFNRMYPDGPAKNQITHATMQLENTLYDLNTSNEELRRKKQETVNDTKKLNDEIQALHSEVDNTKIELQDAHNLIQRLETPINVDNNNIQERLLLLNALEAGGVDNWEWYDESIKNYDNQ